MVNFEITKRQKILETNNDMAHNYYYLICGKIYNESKTKYRKFKYVMWFDIFDLQEYFEKDIISKTNIDDYIRDLEYNCLVGIKNYNDIKKINEFYSYCNKTIERYNNLINS